MLDYREVFGTKYPIVAAAMNQVSDIKLSKAVRHSGGIPSLSIYNYRNNFQGLLADLEDYKKEFNDLKLFLSLGDAELKIPAVLDLVLKSKIEFIELILDGAEIYTELESIVNNGTRVFVKCLSLKGVIPGITGVIIKGDEGAGRGSRDLDTLFQQIKTHYPDLEIIVSGGIGTYAQVKYYMDRGALAVSIGTLFAVAEESKISLETKLKIINATRTDIKQFETGAQQNALIFSSIDGDDHNHTAGLHTGIHNPTAGHVFVGTAIDHITEIKPVAEIIKCLMTES
jgi:NAD(P)H-dependent flavin oxidoreductase YrpB (nitropropane dioxygenase family)